MKAKEVIKLLKKNGFQEIKRKGGHRKFYNPITNKTTEVPYHQGDLKQKTLDSILKQAGLK